MGNDARLYDVRVVPMAWRHGPYTQGAGRERGATSGVHAPAVPCPAPACHPLRCLHRSHCHTWRPSWPRRSASAPLHTRHACVIEPGSTAGPWSSLILGGWGVSKTQHPLHSTAHTTYTHSGNSSQALSPAKACAGPFRGGHEQPTMVEGEAPVCPSTPPVGLQPPLQGAYTWRPLISPGLPTSNTRPAAAWEGRLAWQTTQGRRTLQAALGTAPWWGGGAAPRTAGQRHNQVPQKV